MSVDDPCHSLQGIKGCGRRHGFIIQNLSKTCVGATGMGISQINRSPRKG